MTFLKINNLSVDYQMRKETVNAAKNVNIEVNKGGSIRGVIDRYEAPNSSISYDTNQSQKLDLNNNNTLIETGPFANLSSAKLSAPQFSWFDYEGDSIVLERTGGGFSFARPLNGGKPLKKVPWSVLIGANFLVANF